MAPSMLLSHALFILLPHRPPMPPAPLDASQTTCSSRCTGRVRPHLARLSTRTSPTSGSGKWRRQPRRTAMGAANLSSCWFFFGVLGSLKFRGFSPDPPLAQDPVALCSSTPHMERPIQENRPVALPLPISLRRPEMVRLGATPATECVLSMEASSSTHTLLYKDGEDTASSELIQTTTRNPSGRYL
ncbi:hypothetical protein TRIUR3_06502 [Triticum urartu]|uniref:Uncharacterized protein n=1 Tax=Triticum urartu TaxID=4572 RepID=M7YRU7_TRIUA|nr:hypothetical protein TRIUR3_06502 [Triticum urartu]